MVLTTITADPINEHDIPTHYLHIRNPTNHNIATSHQDAEVEDVLAPGDIVGRGFILNGDVVSLLPTDNDEDEDEQFQVIKELEKRSNAIVYLVQQVPRGASAPCAASSRGRSNTADSEDSQVLGHIESEEPPADPVHKPTKTYGRSNVSSRRTLIRRSWIFRWLRFVFFLSLFLTFTYF